MTKKNLFHPFIFQFSCLIPLHPPVDNFSDNYFSIRTTP